MLLIVGSRSSLGQAVIARLRGADQSGVTLRAGVTKLPRARKPPTSTELVRLDLAKPNSFARALAGVDTVFTSAHALTASAHGASRRIDRDGHIALIEASKTVGVRRFVYTSALGAQADSPAPFWRYKAEVEAHLRASGLPYVILRPAAFMDFHAHALIGAPMLAGGAAKILGSGRSPRNLVAVEDVARVAVRALSEDALLNRTIDIGGPQNLSDRDVVAAYARVAGVQPKVLAVPDALLPLLTTMAAPFHAGVANILRLPRQLKNRDELLFDASEMVGLLGQPPQSLDDFIRARLAD
jgi:uncharacterized protein YbjT (DUF2867 family)